MTEPLCRVYTSHSHNVLECVWCRPGSSTSKCLRCYYIGLMDALYPICPDCLFIGEGTGATSLAANWGETTLQDPALL